MSYVVEISQFDPPLNHFGDQPVEAEFVKNVQGTDGLEYKIFKVLQRLGRVPGKDEFLLLCALLEGQVIDAFADGVFTGVGMFNSTPDLNASKVDLDTECAFRTIGSLSSLVS